MSTIPFSTSLSQSTISGITSVNYKNSASDQTALILTGRIIVGSENATAVLVNEQGVIRPFLFASQRDGQVGTIKKFIPLQPTAFTALKSKNSSGFPLWAAIVTAVCGCLLVCCLAVIISFCVKQRSKRGRRGNVYVPSTPPVKPEPVTTQAKTIYQKGELPQGVSIGSSLVVSVH
jgi:hypothetical protein